jgi:hypothetical protein
MTDADPKRIWETTMPDELKARVESYVDNTRLLMEEQGGIKPMSFIGANNGKELAMFPWGNVPNTEIATAAMRAVCKESNAAWIIVIMEAYVARGDDAVRGHAAIKKGLGIRSVPGREEAVCVMVETRERSWTGIAIQQRDGRRATFGDMKFESLPHNEGRFVGLISTENRKQ